MIRCWCGNSELIDYSEEYYECVKCNTLVSKYSFENDICDVKNEETDIYGSNYWEEVMVREAGVKNLDELINLYISERAIYWIKNSLKYLELGSYIAEVGCGLGQFSYMLKEIGFQQVAFELSPHICKYIEQRLNLKMVCGELGSRGDKYQAILALDVFEHLLEPEKFLLDCAERLEENGMLVLQTPCYDSSCSYEEMIQRKSRFQHLLVPDQHIYLFSRKSMVEILQKHGFQYIKFEPAFFGDDYDMFLFASQSPIEINTEEKIDDYLNSVPNGRLVKALITLFDKNRELMDRYLEANDNIRELERLLSESEADRAARLEVINQLTKRRKKFLGWLG